MRSIEEPRKFRRVDVAAGEVRMVFRLLSEKQSEWPGLSQSMSEPSFQEVVVVGEMHTPLLYNSTRRI